MEAAKVKVGERNRFFLSADGERFVEFDRIPDSGEKQIFFSMWQQALGEPGELKMPMAGKRVLMEREQLVKAGAEISAL